jgi:hypothetical protein
MKKFNSILLFLFICFASVQIFSQVNRAGYNYHTSIDNSVNFMFPSGQLVDNTIQGKSGGTGTETDPYIVATAEDLLEIAIRVNTGTEGSSTIFPNGNMGYSNQYFLVTNDLNLSAYNPWPMIGIPSVAIFYGNFDGGGHIISDLTLNASGNQGLFAVAGNFAVIHGIKVKDSNIHNGNYYTGAVVGAAGENTTIYDCHNYCDITSVAYYTGGIAGASWGTIYNCTNTGNIVGVDFCGGIVGDFYGTIYNCVNTGNITGSTSLGGIIGYSANASIKHLINTGKITGSSVYNGGVIGFVTNYDSDNTTSFCLNMGDVVCASTSSAAVIGRLWTEAGQPSDADNCFYDKQLTLKKGVAPGGDIPGVAEGKFTHEMIGNELSAILGSNFLYTAGLYPCPEGVENKEISHVAIAPASLKYTSETVYDMYNSVNDHIPIALDNDVAWESSDETKLKIANNYAILLNLGKVNLSCTKGDAKKTIELTILTAPAIICDIPVLESVTQGTCSDAPCLLLTFTQANYVTGGYNIYVDGDFLMNVPEWQTVSLTENEISPNETHCFTVTSVCVNGETEHSNEICQELIICNPPVLESVTQDMCAYAPCLTLTFTQVNLAKDGYNIYVDGVFLLNVPEWQTVSLTENDITPNETHCFTVTSVCTDGESNHSNEICIEFITAIGNIENNRVSIYPNPSTSTINVAGDNIETITFIDNLGRVVKKYYPNGNKLNEINIENMKPDFYFIKIEMLDGKSRVEKFVKIIY